MADTLLFWKARPDLAMGEAEIARELNFGEEVAGLIDLPVREIIDRLKQEFPDHDERPGSLTSKTPAGESWEATWGWQFFKIELREPAEGPPPDSAHARLVAILAEYGCSMREL